MTAPTPLFNRNDTFLGVCEGLGQDLRINPLWFRLAFGVALLFSPAVVIATYLTLGVLVHASRRLFPGRRVSAVTAVAAKPVIAENDGTEVKLAA